MESEESSSEEDGTAFLQV